MKARLPRGMGGGPQNMQAMVKQAQKMQEEMEKAQEELALLFLNLKLVITVLLF